MMRLRGIFGTGQKSGEPAPVESADTSDVARVGETVAVRDVALRMARKDGIDLTPRRMLHLTQSQRELLREGMVELREQFTDPAIWRSAAEEAEAAERELAIDNLAAGYSMWTSSIAALTCGSWWLLLPGCGAPVMQDAICESLADPFLERRPEYRALADAISEGRYSNMAQALERAERVRCMVALHVRGQ